MSPITRASRKDTCAPLFSTTIISIILTVARSAGIQSYTYYSNNHNHISIKTKPGKIVIFFHPQCDRDNNNDDDNRGYDIHTVFLPEK